MKEFKNIFLYLNVSWLVSFVLLLIFLFYFYVGYEYEGSTLSEIFNN